jgi:hypothetical protein
MGNPTRGLADKEEDEACEIDSDGSDNIEESKNHTRRQKSNHNEESIRSSRTATFKDNRRVSTHMGNGNIPQTSNFSAV